MKRTAYFCLFIILLCVLCSGCNSWMDGEYLSVTPNEAQPEPYANHVIEVTSYTQLRNAVANLVRAGAEDGIISISAFNKGTIHFYVDTAIANVIEKTAFGAYAVEDITYEIGTNRGVSVVACKIHYRSGYHPQSQIKEIGNANELSNAVIQALDDLDTFVLFHMEQYEKVDIEELVLQHAALYPDRIVEIPQVCVSIYPEKGAERIIEVEFKYERDRVQLQVMRGKVEDAFQSAEHSVDGVEKVTDIYEMLYHYITERCVYRMHKTATPSYNLLVKGEGDDQTFADVYSRMCRRIGLESKTIDGTRDGKPWTWNAVQIRGKYYNLDILCCFENQEFLLKTDDQMTGYEWDN